MLEAIYCRQRQKRLLQILNERKLDAAIIGLSKHVYYLSAHLPFWLQYAGLLLFADGRSALVAAKPPLSDAAVEVVETYEASWNGTQRQEQPAVVAGTLLRMLTGKSVKRIGLDSSMVNACVGLATEAEGISLDADLWQLRRRKDPDELRLMRTAIECCRAMYGRASQIIVPGVVELRVYAELHEVAVEVAGEPLSDLLGNDYACGIIGGPPRKNRLARAGELYILDLGPAYRGYFSDNARTFSVDRQPTDRQMRAWDIVTGVHPIVERMARPGVRCRDIYQAIDEYYQEKTGAPFPHHLGHGVGLQPHEFLHLNPKWDDVLLENEIFTVEPGLYGEELGGGMRIENQYRVTGDGVENLTPFQTALVWPT